MTWLEQDAARPKGRRRTAQKLFEDLQRDGFAGAYDSVQRFESAGRPIARHTSAAVNAFVTLAFAPGDACQLDWSREHVVLGGVSQTIKLAYFRLCHSRQLFVAACPRESQEMLFDAHARAFACMMSYDRNRYSVPSEHAGQRVSLRACADRIAAVAGGKGIVFHARSFARDIPVLDPWHYLPVLEKKPGALREHGADPVETARALVLESGRVEGARIPIILKVAEGVIMF